ncbi:DNA-directed RNA polymerase II subunit RPB1, partial [Nematocida ausubeli]
LKEIINAAQTIKTPSLTIYLKEEIRNTLEGAKKAQQEIERCYLKDILLRSEIIYDPTMKAVKSDEDFIFAYGILDPTIYSPDSPWMLRLVLNRSAMVDRGIRIEQVTKTIAQSTTYRCMHSDHNSAEQIIRCELPNSEDLLRKIETSISCIMVKGMPKIKRVFISEIGAEDKKEYVLQTEGTGLMDVLGHPLIDPTRTVSNDPLEMSQVFGIEAARTSILNEIRMVIESDGSYVNFRHLAILADIMTQRGHICGITRHGTNRGESGALMRCSFEETVEILLEAAANAEIDRCKGVVESVMLGNVAAIGTGITDLLIDKKSIEMGVMAMEKYEFEDEECTDEGTPVDLLSPSSTIHSDLTLMSSSPDRSIHGWSPQNTEIGYSPSSPSLSYGYSGGAYMPSSPKTVYSPYLQNVSSPSHQYVPTTPKRMPGMHNSPGNAGIGAYNISSPSSQRLYAPSSSIPSYGYNMIADDDESSSDSKSDKSESDD